VERPIIYKEKRALIVDPLNFMNSRALDKSPIICHYLNRNLKVLFECVVLRWNPGPYTCYSSTLSLSQLDGLMVLEK
jgi:hypothetical protein